MAVWIVRLYPIEEYWIEGAETKEEAIELAEKLDPKDIEDRKVEGPTIQGISRKPTAKRVGLK